MIGAKTVGHATLIVFDDEPLLVTDPWLGGRGAYFGSWQLSHAIPRTEREQVRACRFVWISHGHPDHLCLDTLESMRAAEILLPDHVGGRIRNDLQEQGFTVRVLPDRRWVRLSPRVRILCLTDSYQNGVLLVDVNGRLFFDLNDASDRGWGQHARELIGTFRRSFLLKLAQTGNLGVMNLFDEAGQRLSGNFIERSAAGAELARHADRFGVTDVIPFSSFHVCQRVDSAWVNPHLGTVEDYPCSFASETGAALLPPFVEIDCDSDEIRTLEPAAVVPALVAPETFGDHWSDPLERDDVAILTRYFESRELLRERVGFIKLRVGGSTNSIVLNRELATGITFEAPRGSLVAAAESEIFDDLLLSHFMRTTLHGLEHLIPAVTPEVTRWADNGGARTRIEVEAYLKTYRRRATQPFLEQALSGPSSALRARRG